MSSLAHAARPDVGLGIALFVVIDFLPPQRIKEACFERAAT